MIHQSASLIIARCGARFDRRQLRHNRLAPTRKGARGLRLVRVCAEEGDSFLPRQADSRKGTDFDINKPGSIDELFDGDEKDREWWETGEPLPDLSQPARNVASWIPKAASSDAPPGESRRRPRWKFWEPVNLEVALDADPSQDMSLVSHGMTVARLMTQEEWTHHRNPFRYFEVMALLVQGKTSVLRRTGVNVACIALYNALVCAFNSNFPQQAMQVNPLPFTILSAFVSLLLVFRTNASYARFLEARLLLGQLVLYTREFARLAVIHFPSYALRQRAMAYASVFAWCLKGRVRHDARIESYVRELLGPKEAIALLKKSKPAFFVLQELTQMVASCEKSMPQYVLLGLDRQLQNMDGALGGCERIISTPIPLSYTRHTTRCILIYLLGLPFAMWPLMGWYTICASAVIAFVTMGIEETGNQIEEPFAVMPLQQLCQVVTATCRETLEYYG